MASINRILAAVKDPMARSLPAVIKATQLARAFGARLELFHVVDSSTYTDMLGITQSSALKAVCDLQEQYRSRLERIAARARLHTPTVTVAVESDYPAYEAIVRRAMATRADLIVVEQHERRSLVPGLLRLPDWELLRLSPMPVLLVKTARPYRRPTVLSAVDPAHAFAKPTDLDESILQVAAGVAGALKGQLHAVHAYHASSARRRGGAPAAAAGRARTAAQAAAARFERALRSYNVLEARRHLEASPPCDAVWRVARAIRADIVVAGAISRSGLKRAFIGNTAELLLDCLPCDLLVVKPAGFRCPVSRGIRGGLFITPQPLG